jgi:hypothetical protein
MTVAFDMAIRRITISVSETLAEQIKKAVGDKPVSQYATELLETEMSEDEFRRQWEEFYREVNPSAEDHEWAVNLMRSLAEAQEDGTADGHGEPGAVAEPADAESRAGAA